MSKNNHNRKATASSDRNFGLVFAIFFAVVGLFPLYRGGTVRWWAIVLGAGFLLCAFALPRLLRPLNYVWSKFGVLLHRFISPIVMAALYFGVFFPAGLLLRTFSKNFFQLKFDKTAASYWISREQPAPPPGGMRKQF